MTRAALYARYSSDNQSAASIEDQFRVCREQAARDGWKIVGAYQDAAVSGASVILRPGVQALLADAQRGAFDMAPAEALDRVRRDQADVATLFKHLRFAGVETVTLAEGEINELHVGLKGAMNALFLNDLATKTHRGVRGRVEKGKSGGGLCYGYDVVKHIDADGGPIRGERTINEGQAEIVRRIFRAFAAGISPHAITRRPNDEDIRGNTRGSRSAWNTTRARTIPATGWKMRRKTTSVQQAPKASKPSAGRLRGRPRQCGGPPGLPGHRVANGLSLESDARQSRTRPPPIQKGFGHGA